MNKKVNQTKHSPNSKSPQWYRLIPGLVLAIIAFLLYANTISNDYNLDDELVTTTSHELSPKGIKAIPEIFRSYYFDNHIGNKYEYRPIVTASFAVEHTFFDPNPKVSHSINVLLYAFTAFLLWWVLQYLFKDLHPLLPILATLIFVAHPLHTEVVASIKNRDEILCFIGGLSSVYFAFRFIDRKDWWALPLFIGCFLFGVLSKRSILPYAALLPLMIVWFRPMDFTRYLFIAIPLAIMTFVFAPTSILQYNLLYAFAMLAFPLGWYVIIRINILSLLKTTKNSIQQSVKDSFEGVESTDFWTFVKKNRLWSILFVLVLGCFVWATLSSSFVGIAFSVFLAALLCICLPFEAALISSILFFALFIVSSWCLNFSHEGLKLVFIPLYFMLRDKRIYIKVMALFCIFLLAATFVFIENDPPALVLLVIDPILIELSIRFKRFYFAPIILLLALVLYLVIGPIAVPTLLLIISVFLILSASIYAAKLAVRFIPLYFLCLITISYSLSPFPLTTSYSFYMDASVTTPQKSNPADIEAGDIELVPRAGREIDFAENGLVNEHRVGYKTATPFVIIGKYLTLLLAPVNLHFYYGYNVIPLVNWAHPIPILVTVILIVVVVFSIMRAKHFPALTFGLVYLTLCLLALSNFGVLVTGMVGERLMYVGSLGFCIALAAVLLQVFKVPKVNVTQYKQIPPVFFFAISIIILGYSVRTITRNTVWKDRLTLFEHDTRNGYPSAKAQQLAGLANVTKAQENFQNSEMYINKAKAYFGKSLSIYPDFTSALQGMAMLYAFKNDCANAMPFLKRSLEIEPFRPEVNYHYAVCLDQLEKYDTAAIYYERVITQTPMDIVAYSNLSFDYYRLGLYERSIQVNQKAISLMPNQIDPYINIGKTYIQIKNYPEAIKYLERALQLKSNDPQLILGILDLHQRLGNEQAIAYYTDLCKRMGIPIPAQQQTPSNPNP